MPDNQKALAALKTVRDFMDEDHKSGESSFWTLGYSELYDTVTEALGSQTPSAPAAGGVSEAIERCDDQLVQMVQTWKRIASHSGDPVDKAEREGRALGLMEARVSLELLKHELAALSAALAGGAGGQEWQDIASAPRDGEYIQGYGPHDARGHYIETVNFYGDRWTIEWMHGFGAPTHWRPLPAPPAPAQTEGA